MPLLKRWLSFSPLYAVSTIYLWLLATTPFTRTQALKADRLRAKKPYRIHHKSYYTIWYFCEWAHCIRNSRVPRGTLYRKWTKRKKPLIYKGFRVVVTVGLEPTTPSMWTMCTGLPVKQVVKLKCGREHTWKAFKIKAFSIFGGVQWKGVQGCSGGVHGPGV